jgi:DNA topoisomerase VI subunit A
MSVIQRKIQSLVLNFIDCLVESEAYQLEVPRNEGVLTDNSCLIRAYDNPTTARKYCQLMSIAALIGEMDATGRHISQRDLYYALKLLFKSQRGQY